MWRAARRRYDPDQPRKGAPPPPEWWTAELDMLALIADRQALQIWQAGGSKGPKPQPIERPGHEDGRRTHRGQPMSPEDYRLRWAAHAAAASDGERGADEGDVEDRPHGAEDDPEDRETRPPVLGVTLGDDEPRDGQREPDEPGAE
jgi:hypothetical protein